MKKIEKVAEIDLNEVIKQDNFLTETTMSGLILSVATLQRRVNQLIDRLGKQPEEH